MVGERLEEIKCQREKCTNTFSKNGKQKYCCHNCAKLDGYHRRKKLRIVTPSQKRISKISRPPPYTLCYNGCGKVTNVLVSYINVHGKKNYIKVGRVCATCRTVTINPQWTILQGVPKMEETILCHN